MKKLRKLFTVIMVLAFCVTVVAGCKTNQADSSNAASTADKSTIVPGNTSAGTSANNSTDNNADSSGKVIKKGTIEKNGNVILKELAFVYKGNTIAISDIVDDEKLEGILGKAVEKKSHTYSNNDGLNMDTLIGFTEKQYKFPGLDIKTIKSPEEQTFNIFNIKITDSKYSTVRNIKVGDSVEKLKEAYPEGNMIGNGAANEEDDFQFLPVNYVDAMKFHVKNKKIESILMYKLLD
jgi:hypothetical protein